MYTWGYIKDATLAKLDLDQAEANEMKLINRFVYYANEVITQVCSSIKPKRMFYEVVVNEENVGHLLTIDDVNFISFSDDMSTVETTEYGTHILRECTSTDILYKGYNQFICFKQGTYHIAYNARWYFFNSSTYDDEVLPIPTDILDSIPSYIASQCYKIDDEYKSSVYRNEYEMFLARIDNTDFKTNTTLTIGGDW